MCSCRAADSFFGTKVWLSARVKNVGCKICHPQVERYQLAILEAAAGDASSSRRSMARHRKGYSAGDQLDCDVEERRSEGESNDDFVNGR